MKIAKAAVGLKSVYASRYCTIEIGSAYLERQGGGAVQTVPDDCTPRRPDYVSIRLAFDLIGRKRPMDEDRVCNDQGRGLDGGA